MEKGFQIFFVLDNLRKMVVKKLHMGQTAISV